MSDNGHTPATSGPMPYQIVIQSDGVRVALSGNVPFDVQEGLLARALAHIQRELLIARLIQQQALEAEKAPRVALSTRLPGPPI